jgi:general secretion pathway protein H
MAERGFTLVEMLVALGIAGLLLTLGLGTMTGHSSVDLTATARQLAAGLREARATAIAANRPVDFRVDLANRAYGYSRMHPFGGPDLRLELLTTEGLREDAMAGSIRFYPDGASTGGGVEVAQGQRRATILVDWMSGQVRVVFDAARS